MKKKKESLNFPIVGIGASAGGLKAFEQFFSGMPKNTMPDMAFILVQHLAPDHKSLLTEIIKRYTNMKVYEVENGMFVHINSVYIIPPNYDMSFENGILLLTNPTAPHGLRTPIDFFFRSLEKEQHHPIVGIILSGTGSDGTLGIRAIKAEGGLVIAQNPSSCEFDGMPLSAIQTGAVDYQLPPVEMPSKIINYINHINLGFGLKNGPSITSNSETDNFLKKIFILLHSHLGHDFSQYKPNTIFRRIERRMAVHHIESLKKYLLFLEEKPDEVQALFQDMLIGVTNFFRDPEVFKALEEDAIPKIFAEKLAINGVIRVWSAGCSTGEEAYSIAILLKERMEFLKQNYTVQIFATDIDSKAIATARLGLYPTDIAIDISPERLSRFFALEPNGKLYRIQKNIRDMVIFSEQNLIKDPPFSKLDLIICRNLLIYLNLELQQKILSLFHYSLNAGGIMLLGTSEGIGDLEELFITLDRKSKLYQKKEYFLGIQNKLLSMPSINMIRSNRAPPLLSIKQLPASQLSLKDLTEQALIKQIISAGVLVNRDWDILYLHGRTGMYLEPSQGEAGVNNVINMARDGLQGSLSMALKNAKETNETVRMRNLRVKTNDHYVYINLCISPVKQSSSTTLPAPYLYLITIEESFTTTDALTLPTVENGQKIPSKNTHERISLLEKELSNKNLLLQNSLLKIRSYTEELKSSNEEMQSINEELQSTNEELETSKEELQSVNEELATVNNELNNKILDLSRINNDMNNFLVGSGIATIFVDLQMDIIRFTPTAAQIINLIPSDIGRPISHIVSNLVNYDNMLKDLKTVIDTLVPKVIEAKNITGNWYSMRIHPYRTIENVVEGAVIAFIDITEAKKLQQLLEITNKKDLLVIHDGTDALIVQDLKGQTLTWSSAATKMYGWSESEALSQNISERLPRNLKTVELSQLIKLAQSQNFESYKTQRIDKNGTVLEVWLTASSLINEQGEFYAIATTERIKGKVNEQT